MPVRAPIARVLTQLQTDIMSTDNALARAEDVYILIRPGNPKSLLVMIVILLTRFTAPTTNTSNLKARHTLHPTSLSPLIQDSALKKLSVGTLRSNFL